ncbi:hypothetical protein CWE15_11735 [Aliidiomarina taiwanensis]|uniref:DUF3718 domain-containing protein n=1 Tax=Aliidiomarina taiwanensis TaxID=946228 RepID=A0A432WTI5_9GAMM|nr:hypothetical protein [Aliidiomarina taiwanensis]RUO37072.1 hypothetical protein CWE15_11735 [Aliidiomarina taiwanensis]
MKYLMVAGAALLSLVYAGSAYANCDANICQGHAEVITPSLKSNAREVMVKIQADAAAGLGCQLVDGEYALLDDKAKQFDLHRSLIMTAIASQSDIRLEFDSKKATCTVESVELSLPI